MTYYLYHIPGKKIGVTRDLKERVERQQGYEPGEYGVLTQTDDIDLISRLELKLQEAYGYRVDEVPYNKLKFNNNNMNINITEMTTTFPCPVNKLKGQLMDNKGMSWETEHGNCVITDKSIGWIMDNVKTSQYTQDRCYIYNKDFAAIPYLYIKNTATTAGHKIYIYDDTTSGDPIQFQLDAGDWGFIPMHGDKTYKAYSPGGNDPTIEWMVMGQDQ